MTPNRRQQVADLVGLNEQYLYQCLTGRRQAPQQRCPSIERASDAEVTCEQLRPDVRWVRVPDAGWPHPGGRPLIDVAGDVQSAAQPGEACNAG